MRGQKSEAAKRREALESKGEIPITSISQSSRKSRLRAEKSRLKRASDADPLKAAQKKGIEIAEKHLVVPQQKAVPVRSFLKQNQDDPVAAARKILQEAMPDMCRRLARIVRGVEAGWSPREQITAMRLSADIAGIVQAPGAGSDVAPLTQASLAELRATIAQGEERMRELQAQMLERQVGSIPGELVEDRTNDPVRDEATCQQDSGSSHGDGLD